MNTLNSNNNNITVKNVSEDIENLNKTILNKLENLQNLTKHLEKSNFTKNKKILIFKQILKYNNIYNRQLKILEQEKNMIIQNKKLIQLQTLNTINNFNQQISKALKSLDLKQRQQLQEKSF